jgi:hypothetical protein
MTVPTPMAAIESRELVLAAAERAKGLRALAKATGIDEETLAGYACGACPIEPDHLAALALYLLGRRREQK